MGDNQPFWASHWDRTRDRLAAWWRGNGLVVSVTAPANEPHDPTLIKPDLPADHLKRWSTPSIRFRRAEYQLAQTFFGGEAFPYFDTEMGPGSLGMFLGAEPEFVVGTAWYHECIEDLATHPPLRFDRANAWVEAQLAIVQAGVEAAAGRFLVGMPDLIENIDCLAQLRGTQTLLMDMLETPELVEQRLWEINAAYFEAFDAIAPLIRDDRGGNAFSAFKIWGPGKTAKVQCDASVMFSPGMFRQFVVPPLTEQCQWLDHAMYHLDGTQAIVHLDALLEIEALDAVEWTPQAGEPQGGSPKWFDLYRRIKSAGKAVQAIAVAPEEVVPLIDAIGPAGTFVLTPAKTQAAAEELVKRVESYR